MAIDVISYSFFSQIERQSGIDELLSYLEKNASLPLPQLADLENNLFKILGSEVQSINYFTEINSYREWWLQQEQTQSYQTWIVHPFSKEETQVKIDRNKVQLWIFQPCSDTLFGKCFQYHLGIKIDIDPGTILKQHGKIKPAYESYYKLGSFLQSISASTLAHNQKKLSDHLLQTYVYLYSATNDEIISLIGGLHSVYGSIYYPEKALSLEETKLGRTFGPIVDYYVRLYASMDRQKELDFKTESSLLSEEDKFVLRWVEFYNGYEQGLLEKAYPPEFLTFFQESYPNVKDRLNLIWSTKKFD